MDSQSPAQVYSRPVSSYARSSDGTESRIALFGGGGDGRVGRGPILRVQSVGREVTLDALTEPEVPLHALGSLNMDEFLDNLWTLEESQAMACVNAIWAPERSVDVGLSEQPSTPHTGCAPRDANSAAGGPSDRGDDKRASTWAGSLAATFSFSPVNDSQSRVQKPVMDDVDWLRNGQQQMFQADVTARALSPWVGQMGVQPMVPARDPISDTVERSHRIFGVDGSIRGRRRGTDGRVERVMERRQLRMIKNRDSAARSRARKQAYTVELEAEVTQLKEDNNRLKTLLEQAAKTYEKLILDTVKAKKNHKPVLRRLRKSTSGRY